MELEWIKIYKTKYKKILLMMILLIGYLIVLAMGLLKPLDQLTYSFLHSLMSDEMTVFMTSITHIGSWIGVTLICLICLFLHFQKGLVITSQVIIVTLLNQVIKYIVMRPRPSVLRLVVETGYSFPSAHAMVSFALFGFIAYLFINKNKGLSLLIMCLPILIGISRVYVGVHYASDVMAGFLFSLTYLILVIPLLKYHKFLPES